MFIPKLFLFWYYVCTVSFLFYLFVFDCLSFGIKILLYLVYCIVLKPPLIVFCRGVTRAVAAADRSRSTSPDGLHSAAKSVRPHACMRAH